MADDETVYDPEEDEEQQEDDRMSVGSEPDPEEDEEYAEEDEGEEEEEGGEEEEEEGDEDEEGNAFAYDDDDNELSLQKFDQNIRSDYLTKFHPESQNHNFSEVQFLTQVLRHATNGIVIDEQHKTLPFLTKYERTRILGQRAKQINAGAEPCVSVPPNVIDGYVIANLELQAKKIPFIIKRTFHNGGSEYWNVRDLELL